MWKDDDSMDKGKGAWRVVITNSVVSVSLIEKGTFELRPEGGKGVKHMPIWRKKDAGRGNMAEARVCLAGSRNSKACCEAGVVWVGRCVIKMGSGLLCLAGRKTLNLREQLPCLIAAWSDLSLLFLVGSPVGVPEWWDSVPGLRHPVSTCESGFPLPAIKHPGFASVTASPVIYAFYGEFTCWLCHYLSLIPLPFAYVWWGWGGQDTSGQIPSWKSACLFSPLLLPQSYAFCRAWAKASGTYC